MTDREEKENKEVKKIEESEKIVNAEQGIERWAGRVAVVTGGSSPIGKAICEDLVRQGLIVCGLATKEEGKHELECDITEEGHVQPICRYIGDYYDGVDLLINNASIMTKGLILDDDNTPVLREVMETNIIGMCIITREIAQLMAMRKEERKNLGHVVNILSIVGHKFGPNSNRSKPRNGLYPASRHAATAITECIRQEFLFRYENVKITDISPGFVEGQNTDILTDDEICHEKMPALAPKDVSAAVIYAISVKANVQIQEIKIKPVGEFI